MLKNYFKIAWRNLMKNKVFSLINLLGLTIGITVCMMIFLFIVNEFSVDEFHVQKKNIYRVMRGYKAPDVSERKVAYLSPPYATALLNDYPAAIQEAVRVMSTDGLVSFGDHSFKEKNVYIADDGFFTLFSFPLVRGNAAAVLKDPASVVLTETTAKKYFGKEDPIDKIIEFANDRKLKVTGIVEDPPSNSHLDFDLVIPLSNYYHEDWFKDWINNNLFTYVLLNEGASAEQMNKSFPGFMDKYMGKEMARSGMHFDLSLTPLTDIYFESVSSFDDVRHGDKKVTFIFLSVALLILLIACINFMNLSTIQAVERSKEVGLRKVMGAVRRHVIGQFIGESVLLTLISAILAIGLLQLLLPLYSQLLGYSLTISWNAWPIYLFLLGVVIVVGLVSGYYPAFALSAHSPIQALKGKLRLGKGGSRFRKALVILQFSISVLLIVSTIVIAKQMNYVKNKETGYDKEQTVILPIDNGDIDRHLRSFENELQNSSGIASVSVMSGEPGGFFDVQTFEVEGQQSTWRSRTEFADFEFVETLGLKIIAGRNFSAEHATDSTDAVLINRTASERLGFSPEQAIGKWIKNTIRDSKRRRIIGVVEDFNFLSLKENMDALVISPSEDWRVALIKTKPGHFQTALTTIEKAYSRVAPAYPFDFRFLDQQFDELYKKDIRNQTLISIFSGLAIFIACLGLFGLASFTARKRMKEIGVRKVLGSSVQDIVVLMFSDMLKPVLIATLIALPVGYYAMNSWLQNFAYQTSLHWWIFALASLLTLLIATLTISFQSIKAALMNPVKSLRSE